MGCHVSQRGAFAHNLAPLGTLPKILRGRSTTRSAPLRPGPPDTGASGTSLPRGRGRHLATTGRGRQTQRQAPDRVGGPARCLKGSTGNVIAGPIYANEQVDEHRREGKRPPMEESSWPKEGRRLPGPSYIAVRASLPPALPASVVGRSVLLSVHSVTSQERSRGLKLQFQQVA